MVKMRSSKARAEVLTPGWEVTEPRRSACPTPSGRCGGALTAVSGRSHRLVLQREYESPPGLFDSSMAIRRRAGQPGHRWRRRQSEGRCRP